VEQVDHRFLQIGNAVVHHFLRVGTGNVAAQLVNSRHEDHVLLGDAVEPWLWVLLYVAGSGTREGFNDELEHRWEFWPQNHADEVVVQVKHRDFQI